MLIHKEYALKYPLVKLQELLENFPLGKMHPFINSQSTIIFWIRLLKQSLVSILAKRSKTMFKRGSQKLVQHWWKGGKLDEPLLLHIMFSEYRHHVPHVLRPQHRLGYQCCPDELLVSINSSVVNDRMTIHKVAIFTAMCFLQNSNHLSKMIIRVALRSME